MREFLTEYWQFLRTRKVYWIAPLLLIAFLFGRGHVLTELAWFFSKLAVVTFGGAYAVLGPKRLGYDAGISCHGTQMLDYLPEMEGCAKPVCVLWGDEDVMAPAQVLEAFAVRFGQRILERYGMTETNMNTSNPYQGERRAGTVGMPLPGVELRIMEGGKEVAKGDVGVIEVRGPNVFQGYWQMPETTAQRFVELPFGRMERRRFYRTGDLVDRHGTWIGTVPREARRVKGPRSEARSRAALRRQCRRPRATSPGGIEAPGAAPRR